MSLLSNFASGDGGFSGAGLALLGGGGGGDEVTVEEVAERQRIAGRVKMIEREIPELGKYQPSMLNDLASSDATDDDLMRAAISAFGVINMDNEVTKLKGKSKDEQRGLAANMNPIMRDALVTSGWDIPTEGKDGGGFFGAVKGIAGGAAKGAAFGVKFATSLPGVKQGLAGMDYVAEEAGRINRVAPQSQSGKDLLAQTGMSEQQLMEQTGIAVPGADIEADLMNTGFGALNPGGLAEIARVATNPKDIWKGVQVWNQVGHEGDDDILPQTQYQVFNELQDAYADNVQAPGAKEMLRWAKGIASGMTLEELAEDEGFQGEQAVQFVQQVGLMSQDQPFKNAVSKLTGGRMSAGRNVARLIYDDPTKDTRQGAAKYISGSIDLAYSVTFDPTLVAGKLSKSIKAVKWGFRGAEGGEKLNRWQEMVRALDRIEDARALGKTDEAAIALDAAKTQFDQVAGSRKFLRSTVAEAEAVRAPAKAIQKAFQTGNWGEVTRKYPMMMRSIDDMKQYNAALKGAGLKGMDEDAGQVFEFFKEAAAHRNVLNSGGKSMEFNTKLFGHDGNGMSIVPHSTTIQKARLAAKEGFARLTFGQLDEIPEATLREIKEADEEAAADVLRASGMSEEEIAERAAGMEVDAFTGGYVKKQPNFAQRQLYQFRTLVAKSVPPRGFVALEGERAVDDFGKWNETLGLIEGANPLTRQRRLNRFINGTTVDRHLLVNEMIGKMASVSGLADTTQGQELIKRYVRHDNHIYGVYDEMSAFGDRIAQAEDVDDAARMIQRQAILEKQLAEGVSIPSMREMMIAGRKMTMARRVFGTVRGSHVEAAMSKVWKPSVVMRFGFPLRAGFDEAIQYMGRVSLRRYLNTAVLEKWAGINQFKAEAGQIVAVGPQGAIKLIRSLTRGVATLANGADEAVRNRFIQQLALTDEYIAAGKMTIDDAIQKLPELRPHLGSARNVQEAMVMKAMADQGRLKNLPFVPKVFRAMDDMAWWSAAGSSKVFHAFTRTKYVTRQHWAEFLLKQQVDGAASIQNRRLLGVHTLGQQDNAEIIGHSMSGLRPNDSRITGMQLREAKSSPSGYQALPMVTDRTTYEWVGHNDLTGMYLNMSHWMEAMAASPSSRAALYEIGHHVPQRVVDEIGGLDELIALRDVVAANPVVRQHLAHAATSEADRASIVASLDANGIEADDLAEYSGLLEQWDTFSPDTKQFISNEQLYTDKLTTDFDLVQDRAANAIYNAMRRMDGQGNLRSMARAQTVDGKVIAEPLQRDHTRVYTAMLDRRNAEDIARMFQDPDMATSFAQAFERQLKARNLFGEFAPAWASAPPSRSGYDIATWLAGIKADIAAGGDQYIAAAMSGSTNYAVAEAIRDALTDVMPDTMLRPTIGYLDQPNLLFDDVAEGYSRSVPTTNMERLSDSVVAMQPHHAVKMKPIDPDAAVRQVHVQLADGSKMWVGADELGTIGRTARMEQFEVHRVNKSKRMLTYDGRSKRIGFNSDMIDQDFKDGMSFLNGTGGHYKRTKASWGWDDPEYATKADELEQGLNQLGLEANIGMNLQDLVGLYRTRQLRPGQQLPMQGVMEDNDLWDDFVELATTSKKKGKRVTEEWTDEVAVQRSKIAKAALDEMGIDVAALGIKRKDYKRFLLEREKAHAALDPAGFGRSNTISRESLEREKDALAIAFQRAKIDVPNVDLTERIKVAIGKEKSDYTVLGEIWGSGITEDAAVRKASQHILNEVNHVMIGKKTGEVHHGVLAPLLRGEHETSDLIRLADVDDLPSKAFGPTRVVAEKMRWDSFVNRFFQGYAEPAISAISRTPMFNDAFDQMMKTWVHVYDNSIHKGLDNAATDVLRRVGINPDEMDDINHLVFRQLKNDPQFGADAFDSATDYARALNDLDINAARAKLADLARDQGADVLRLTDDEMTTLLHWHRMKANAMENLVDRAQKRAIEAITPYVDDHNIRSALQEYLGPVFIPFYYAEEQFLRRFARGLYETPHMLRKGQLMMNGMRNLGTIRTDANGNEIFVIPGSEILMSHVADIAVMVTGNEALQILDQPLAMRTEFILPGWNTEQSRWGWGPIIGISKDGIGRRYPELNWTSEQNLNKKPWDYVMPSSVRNAYQAFIADPDPAQVNSAQMAAISYLEANGKGLPENASATQREKYLQDINQVSRTIGVMRFVTGQVGFTTSTPIDQEAMFRKEFTDLLAQGLDYEDALAVFIENHEDMDNPLVYTIFKTQNETGAPLPPTGDAFMFMRENKDLLTDYPTSAVWLMPQEKTDDKFDRRAYNEQLALGLRSEKSPDELLDQVYIKQAAEEYYDEKDIHDSQRRGLVARRDAASGATRQRYAEELSVLDDEWQAWKNSYMAMHPVFKDSFSPEASTRRKETVRDLEWMIAAGIGGKQGDVIEPLLDAYLAFQREYETYGDQSSKAAKELKAQTLDRHFDIMWRIVQDDPRTATFWNSVIRPELPDQAEALEENKLNPNAQGV